VAFGGEAVVSTWMDTTKFLIARERADAVGVVVIDPDVVLRHEVEVKELRRLELQRYGAGTTREEDGNQKAVLSGAVERIESRAQHGLPTGPGRMAYLRPLRRRARRIGYKDRPGGASRLDRPSGLRECGRPAERLRVEIRQQYRR